jgi:hypothetical protein
VKNLEPTAEMVGMAVTVDHVAAKTRRTRARIEAIVGRSRWFFLANDALGGSRDSDVRLFLKFNKNENLSVGSSSEAVGAKS